MPKVCPNCDKEIGDNDKKCPACNVDLEALEEEVSAIERANRILAKRAQAKADKEEAERKKKAADEAAKNPAARSPFLRRMRFKKES